jgi:ubiquinone/menaquinone biosynthesis C-methylase UbiE
MKNWDEYAKHGDLRSVIDCGDTLGFKNNYINFMQHKILSDNMGDLNGKRVLDLGCGIGRFTKLLQDLGADVIGIDSCNDMLKHNSGKTVCAPTDNLPFEDKYFDVVLSVWTLQYLDLKPLVKTVEEINRVLNVDGDVYLIEQISDHGYDYVYSRHLSDYVCAFREMNNFLFISSIPIMRERDKIVGVIRHGIIPDKYFESILPYHMILNKYLNLRNTNGYTDYFMHFRKGVV